MSPERPRPSDPAPAAETTPADEERAEGGRAERRLPGEDAAAQETFATAVIEGSRPRFGPMRLVVLVLAALLAIALLAWVLPALTGASWPAILRALIAVGPGWATLLALLAVLVLLVSASGLAAAVPSLRYPAAVRTLAVTMAVRDGVPGGGTIALALLYALLRRRGVPARQVVVGGLLASLTDLAVSSLLPAVGLLAYLLLGRDLLGAGTVTVLAALAVGSAVLMVAAVLVLRGPRCAGLAGTVAAGIGSLPVGPDADRARDIAAHVIGGRDAALLLLRLRGARIVVPPLLVRALQAGIVAVSLRAVGLDLPAAATVVVLVVSRVLAAIPLTPSGTGFAEPGIGATLVALGADGASAAAAALLVTVTTVVLPLLMSAVAAPWEFADIGRRQPRRVSPS